jgi:hypothetical protein
MGIPHIIGRKIIGNFEPKGQIPRLIKKRVLFRIDESEQLANMRSQAATIRRRDVLRAYLDQKRKTAIKKARVRGKGGIGIPIKSIKREFRLMGDSIFRL